MAWVSLTLRCHRAFTLLFPQLSQASSLHVDVGAYYDTPVIGLRDVLLPRILNDHRSHGVIDDRQKRGWAEDRDAGAAEEGDEVRKWFRNVKNAASTDTKVVGGVDLMHVRRRQPGAKGRVLTLPAVADQCQRSRAHGRDGHTLSPTATSAARSHP